MQNSSPGYCVLKLGIASTHRTAYGLLVTASNALHVWGKTVPPGLYFRPLREKPGQLSSASDEVPPVLGPIAPCIAFVCFAEDPCPQPTSSKQTQSSHRMAWPMC